MTDIRIFGYSDPMAAKMGEPVNFMVSAEGTSEAQIDIVRLVHGDFNPAGPGFIEEVIETDLPKSLAVHRQYTQNGSYAHVADPTGKLSPSGAFTMFAFIWPSLPGGNRQTIMGSWSVNASKGYALGINPEGKLEFWVGDGKKLDQVTSDTPLVPKVWLMVAASYDPATGQARLRQISVQNSWNSHIGPVTPYDHNSHVVETLRASPAKSGVAFMLAGAHETNPERGDFVSILYNGKIDRPGIVARALSGDEMAEIATGKPPADPLAYWDTTAGYTDRGIGTLIQDTGPNGLHAQGENR
ncbi:MAG: LamG domain-containing protein, partial [Rhodobacteraceae bacterium]|nr:LamG domain-containing protein [Paracoccaceae bacterium]